MAEQPKSGPGAGVNEDGEPWWHPPGMTVTDELLAAGAETQRRIRELTAEDQAKFDFSN